MDSTKKSYMKPEISTYGKVENLTLGGARGSAIDRDFPRGTTTITLTFS